VRVGVEIKRDALVLRVDQRDLQRGMLCGDCGTFKQKYDAGIVNPGAQNRIKREASPAKIFVEVFLLNRTRAFVG